MLVLLQTRLPLFLRDKLRVWLEMRLAFTLVGIAKLNIFVGILFYFYKLSAGMIVSIEEQ
jgi:hypothetical protein